MSVSAGPSSWLELRYRYQVILLSNNSRPHLLRFGQRAFANGLRYVWRAATAKEKEQPGRVATDSSGEALLSGVNKPAPVALLLSLTLLGAQDQTPLFRTTSELVLVDIQVLRVKTGAPAGALRSKDLRVFEEGVPQEIRQFSRDEFPLSVVMLFDLTEGGQAVAMRGRQPEERLAQLIDELRARYTIGYRPPESQAAGTFRKIRVELAPDGALRAKEWTVLAREGYYRK
jgi:hypothetical protein